MPFVLVPVWNRIKFLREDPVLRTTVTADSIHVQPSTIDTCGRSVPGRFDIALVNKGTGRDTSVEGESSTLYYMTKLTERCQRLPC